MWHSEVHIVDINVSKNISEILFSQKFLWRKRDPRNKDPSLSEEPPFFYLFTCRYELDCKAEHSAQQEWARERWFTANVIGQHPSKAIRRYLDHRDEHEIYVLISSERHGIQW